MKRKARTTPSLEALRRRVEAHLAEHGDKVAFANALGVGPSSVTGFLNGETNPRIDRIDAIAKFLGVYPVGRIFDVPVSSPVTASTPESASHAPTGERPDGTDVDLLRAQLADAKAENAALRRHVATLAEEIVAVARGTTPATAARTAKRRRDRG